MAYDGTKPADDEYLSAFPAEAREQLRAIIEDQIVNASKLQGLVPGNSSGQLPVSNGNVNTNLNADQVDGKEASYFSPSTHGHSDATQNADGFMSKVDKTKLDGVATGAEVNQNAFSNVAVGSITIQADGKQDTLMIEQGANITITADATNDRLTFAVSGTVPNATNATNATTAATCTGNSATATKWQTARKIGGVSVDGSADIDLPGVNKAGTQDTSGSATKHGGYTVAQLFDYFHPVGSIYESTNNANPADIWGVGTWEAYGVGRVLVGAGTADSGTTYTVGGTGGEEAHALSTGEMPSHGHNGSTSTAGDHAHSVSTLVSGSRFVGGHSNNNCTWGTATTSSSGSHSHTVNISSTGGGQSHNNMQPYKVIYRWQRTA